MAFAYLDDETLKRVRAAAIELGFAISESALLDVVHDISPLFLGQVMVGGTAPAKLDSLLRRMNTTRALVSGEKPLLTWLDNAIFLAAGREQELVFRRALERASPDGAAPPTPAAAGPVPAEAKDVEGLPAKNGELEIQIAEDDTIEVDFLHRGSEAARSVAKVLVHRHFDGVPQSVAGNKPEYGKGTGWLIAPTLLITNHHVVTAREKTDPPASEADFALQAAATQVLFDYDTDKDTSSVVEVRASGCEASDADLDFALLRLPDDVADRPALMLRTGPITKPKDTGLRERVNVLQHPHGKPMRLGFRDNFVVSGTADRLSYLTDTAGGASGSPLFDDGWLVGGLHRGFATIEGEPLKLWGKTIRQENYGTPIGLILNYLANEKADLHAEIVAGQAKLHV
jgi:endonuclease G